MTTEIKLIQILVSLLKQNNIRHIVISPGTRHVPLVHCVEVDSYFKCYSVVDERSAAYFALGLSEALDEPVCVTCTSSTAACNYMPAMQEAFERNIQLVALTSDKARDRRFHGVSQVIDQVNMYTPFCKYSVDVPIVNNHADYIYANRLLNEALLELNHHGKGPVQINFLEPVSIPQLATFIEGSEPKTRKISRYENPIQWSHWAQVLRAKKRILVCCGQYFSQSNTLDLALEKFANTYNAVITYDNFSNVRGRDFILSPLFGQTMNGKEIERLKPEIIISYGSKVYSDLFTRYYDKGIEQWDVNPEGKVFDSTGNLINIFECTPIAFFENLAAETGTNEGTYLQLWKDAINTRSDKFERYSNYYVAHKVLEKLPLGSLVHASVLNSMKFTNYYPLDGSISAFGNICADGIDGALSTFLGQAQASDNIALLIVGDLSFLYDLNATEVLKKNNIRVLIINNYAGGEFHYNISQKKISTLNQHIAASHHTRLEEAKGMLNAKYISAGNKEELESAVNIFFEPSDTPKILEVFTDANADGELLREFLRGNHVFTGLNKVSLFVKGIIGESTFNRIKKIIHR